MAVSKPERDDPEIAAPERKLSERRQVKQDRMQELLTGKVRLV